MFLNTVDISMRSNQSTCRRPVRYSYEADFILKKNGKNLARSFNFKFRYINAVISLILNLMTFDNIYPIVLEIKDTVDTARSASYLYLHMEINIDQNPDKNETLRQN